MQVVESLKNCDVKMYSLLFKVRIIIEYARDIEIEKHRLSFK